MISLYLLAQLTLGAPDVVSCDDAFVVEVAAPAPGAPSATLHVRRRGEGMRAQDRWTCVRRGSDETLLGPGQALELPIAADARALQRMTVGEREVLVVVEPGGRLSLRDQPCFDWALTAPWLDPFGFEAPQAYCAAPGAECREGFAKAGPPGPVRDPLCEAHHPDGDSSRRCVEEARVTVKGKQPVRLDEGKGPVELAPRTTARVSPTMGLGGCVHPVLRVAGDEVMLIVPAGAMVEVESTPRIVARLR